MVAKRFFQIRYKGVQKGKPSHAQAAKTLRVLSALMHYTKGDDLIEFNPVKVLNKNDFICTFLSKDQENEWRVKQDGGYHP